MAGWRTPPAASRSAPRRRPVADLAWRAAVKPLLFALDAETAHRVAFRALRMLLAPAPARAVVRRLLRVDDPALVTHALGTTFRSPVGLAAGFDKDAEGHRELAALGFGFVEIGTVTPLAQPGNPRPRLFRLPRDGALVNRMGFNSAGADAVRARLAARPSDGAVLGVNVGKNKSTPEERAGDDFATAAQALGPLAAYVAVNVSSPNTPGLRDLQAVERLRPLLVRVRAATDRPVLVKIAPDLSDDDVDAVADLALELDLAGIIATNTTIARDGLLTPEAEVEAAGAGGLSGAPLRDRSLAVLRRLRARTGDRLVLVAAGGIADADEAWARIRAGATLVELYTGFVYGGPATPARLGRGLAARARVAGLRRVQDAVGAEAS